MNSRYRYPQVGLPCSRRKVRGASRGPSSTTACRTPWSTSISRLFQGKRPPKSDQTSRPVYTRMRAAQDTIGSAPIDAHASRPLVGAPLQRSALRVHYAEPLPGGRLHHPPALDEADPLRTEGLEALHLRLPRCRGGCGSRGRRAAPVPTPLTGVRVRPYIQLELSKN